MRFAAAATVTGLIGLLLIEALKILLTPVAIWLLGVVMVAVKVVAVGFGLLLALVGSFWAYRKFSQDRDEIVV